MKLIYYNTIENNLLIIFENYLIKCLLHLEILIMEINFQY